MKISKGESLRNRTESAKKFEWTLVGVVGVLSLIVSLGLGLITPACSPSLPEQTLACSTCYSKRASALHRLVFHTLKHLCHDSSKAITRKHSTVQCFISPGGITKNHSCS